MSKNGNKAKLELIINYINDIHMIVLNHGTIEDTLASKEGEYSTMMCIVQIGEIVSRITEPYIIEKLPVTKIVGLRNRIVHGYEIFDRRMIIDVIKIHIPELKNLILEILEEVNGKL